MSALALFAAAPNVVAMSEIKQPAPLVPADCDLRGLPCMLLDTLRLTRSGLVSRATGDEFRAAVLLWCESWSQLPAASLPDDDCELAHLAHVTRTRWKRLRAVALRGWIKCSDGRLYHPVVAEKAREAWQNRLNQRRRANKRWGSGSAESQETSQETAENCGISENPKENTADLGRDSHQINDLADAAAMPINGNGKDKRSNSIPSDEGMGAVEPAPLDLTLPEDNVEAIKRQLFTEGLDILGRLKPEMPTADRRSLIGKLAKVHGGGSEGGARAVQVLRDTEAGVAGRSIMGDPGDWLWGIANGQRRRTQQQRQERAGKLDWLIEDMNAGGLG